MRYGLAARDIGERVLPADEWVAAVPLILLRAHTWLGDFEAVDQEVAAALAVSSLTEPARLVLLMWAFSQRKSSAVTQATPWSRS